MCFVAFLRFTSGATPADILDASMATKPILIHILAHIQAMVGLESGMECAAASQHRSANRVYLKNLPELAYPDEQSDI